METNKLTTKILLLNGTQDNWSGLKSYVLSKGEPAIEFIPTVGSSTTTLTAVKVKIGDGFTSYEDLPYIGDEIAKDLAALVLRVNGLETEIENLKTTVSNLGNAVFEVDAIELEEVEGDTESDKLAAHITEDVKEGNIAIVKKTINEAYTKEDGTEVPAHYSYTAYVYNGEAWAAMDGNYNASNVYFDDDFTFTKAIGTVTIPSSGSTVVEAEGKSLKDFFAGLFAAEDYPTKPSTSASITSSNIGAKEVGTNIAVAYSFSTSAGAYKYGPTNNGVTWSDYEATFNGETKTGSSGTFSSVQVTDSTNLSITGSVEQSAGAVPKTNIGNDYPSAQITAKSWTGLTKGTLTGYRAWFCGYKNGDNAIKNPETGAADATLITGDQIRALGNSANGSWKSSMDVAQMQQMFFAAPAGKGYKPAVADSKTTAPQTVLGPITVYVKGANNYVTDDAPNGIAYDVWYVNNTSAAAGSATLTIKKA